ncbi:SNF5-domain-containing protein [Heliocybe sulcata]|uniref:SNF5-domain-containing protein n=1 Tax=Heliocybe sulcata TaxID=5364 RepID=A0A5C3NHP0_9AGAM|nr:SNF5-domain-containing protein [Heliocybe sulcata]
MNPAPNFPYPQNGGMNMNNMNINPAALAAQQQSQGNKFPYGGGALGGGFNLNPQMFQQQMQMKGQMRPGGGQQQFFDGQRPGSSAQNMNMPNMNMGMHMAMPPPASLPPRPPTSASPSRPGTAQSHASMSTSNPMSMNPNPGANMMSANPGMMPSTPMNPGANMNMGMMNPAQAGMMGMNASPGHMNMGMGMMNANAMGGMNMMAPNPTAMMNNLPRTPSRPPTSNGYPGQGQGQPQNPPTPSQHAAFPGSPFHGVKRKLAESPRMQMQGMPMALPPNGIGAGPSTPVSASSASISMGMPGGLAVPGVEMHKRQSSAPVPDPTGMLSPSKSGQGTSTPVAATNAATPATSPVKPSAPIPQLPPLPRTVSLNPATTKVTVVPLAGSDAAVPALSASEIGKVKEWMAADSAYEAKLRASKERMTVEIREGWVNGRKEDGGVNGSVVGPAWWEKGFGSGQGEGVVGGVGLAGRFGRREKFGIGYPKKQGEGRRKVGRREGLKLPRKIAEEDANRVEQLVPIRLEFDVDHHKMRDTFVWNLNDPIVTPEIFAQSIVDDYNMPQSYHSTIVKSIQEQLSDSRVHSTDGEVHDSEPQAGVLGEEEAAWWEGWRKRLRVSRRGRFVRKGKGQEVFGELGSEELLVDEDMQREEMRIVIKLDIIVGAIKLDDQIEWDLNNEDASPERFAEVYGRELGLAGEFITAIAHSIREQIHTFQKSLFLVGHPADGSIVQDDDLRMTFLPPLSSAARPMDQVSSFTPMLNYMDDSEIEKSEREREKEMNRRRKRNTRGRRGVALPDREPMRTYRTPAIGFPEVDPATLAAAAIVNVPTRRAAAAAASLTIANMVASENGTAVLTPQMPVSLLPAAGGGQVKKEKNGQSKGLFKPPELPPAAFRARAKVKAPTESTAVDASLLPPPLADDPPVLGMGAGAPDSRASALMRMGRPKTARELEREAKEKEYADGQHPNMIDGVWHCSNCGCPENIAVGRRKGPLGDKTQCGQCGKYWHRHRRPRPVDWNSSPDHHRNLVEETERAKGVARRKNGAGAAALRAMSNATEQDASGSRSRPNSVARTNSKMWVEIPPPAAAAEAEDEAKDPVSPMSSGSSSASESPLMNKIKPNGVNHANQSATPVPRPGSAADAPASAGLSQTPSNLPPSSAANASSEPPEWLSDAMAVMRERYPQDRFETILKRLNPNASPEWRIKCLDCPGKLYTPGPGETLSNYEVHLKNRQHRQKVTNRVNGTTA